MNVIRHTDANSVRWFLGLRGFLVVSILFVAVVASMNFLVRLLHRHVVKFDFPTFWPLGMFLPRSPGLLYVVMAIAVFILFYIIIRLLQRSGYRLGYIIIAGVALVVATNLLQGWEGGFVDPIAGGGERGIQIYHDAIHVDSAAGFVRRFEEYQPDLLVHAQTHPPGAVLSIYFLYKLLHSPAAIALVIATLSTVLSMLFLNGILASELGETRLVRFLTLLFILVPSVEIYYAASIDALIGSFLLGTIYFFMRRRMWISITGSIVFVFLASFMTFGFLFVFPVIAITEILMARRPVRSGVTIALLTVIYVIVHRVFDFNYLASFATATSLENPRGFMLIADPASYVFTRLEGLLEIVVFFGPFLSIMAIRGFRVMKSARTRLFTMVVVAVATLVAMLLTGAFRTGETARCCLFVYPYLMFPVALYSKRESFTQREETVLLSAVFAQTVCMQLFGSYFW